MDKNIDIASKYGASVELNSKYSTFSKQGSSAKPKDDAVALLKVIQKQSENNTNGSDNNR